MSIDPDRVNSRDELLKTLQVLDTRLDAMLDRMDDIEARLDDLEDDVGLAKASVPEQSKTKMDNVVAIVKHAYEKDTGGRAGTKIPSGEVTAVIDGSKQTALRLMDEIGGKFGWAETENPGGPKPKQLKIKTVHDLSDRLDRVVETYSA